MTEDQNREFYKQLRERIHQLRMGHLFEETSEWDDLSDCRMTYDYDDDDDDDEDGEPKIFA